MTEPRSYFELFRKDENRVTYPAGKVIFEEGLAGAEMYVVNSGTVEMKAGGKVLETIEAGGIFGEMALVDNEPRSASATALTECELVAIDSKRFEYLLSRMPFFAVEVMRVMAQRLRRSIRA